MRRGRTTSTLKVEKIIREMDRQTFHVCVIKDLNRDVRFSRLRCGGARRLTKSDREYLSRKFTDLGITEKMNDETMERVAYAITKRAMSLS